MKKILALCLTAVLMLSCLTACDTFDSIFGGKSGVGKEYYENCAVFTFDDFESKICIELDRTGLGEGAIYYQINLEEGALSVNYKDTGIIHQNQALGEFTADDEMPINGSGGYIEGDKIAITFEAFSPVSGEIIIAFTEDALKAVNKELQLHEHSFTYTSAGKVGHYTASTCGCPSEEGTTPHYDGNTDYICDFCKCDMTEFADEWQYDETHHWYVSDDDATSVYCYGEHENYDADLNCDICSYQMVAEGNHFIRNQAGAEWLREITAEDIAEIKMISGGGGPLPPVSKTHISSSRNKAVIMSIFEDYYWLDSIPVSEERTQIADGGYFIVQFILNNGETKQLYFINGDYYHDGNGKYFELVRLPVFRDGTDFVTRYGFERQYNPCQIHLMDETPVCEIPFSEFEFTELTDDIYLDAELPTHYFELHGERVYFIKGEYFYIGDNRSAYYQLIGNLDELIANYNTTTE